MPYIDVNQPWVYMCSPSWTPSHLPPHPIPLGHPSSPVPSTLSHASNLDWQFVSHMIIYMFQCHSIPPSPSPREYKRLFYTSVSLLLSRIQGHCYHLSKFHIYVFSSVQLLSHVRLFATPWIAACQVSLSITNSQSSFRLTSIEVVMPSSHLILCGPLLLLSPIPPRVFSNESTLRMRWPKYWSFSFSIIPSKEIPRMISFRMDWLDILAVQGTCKSLLQHHSSKASILQHSAFFTVQISHPYMTTGKTIALTRLKST